MNSKQKKNIRIIRTARIKNLMHINFNGIIVLVLDIKVNNGRRNLNDKEPNFLKSKIQLLGSNLPTEDEDLCRLCL
jgi:hypothetical protein